MTADRATLFSDRISDAYVALLTISHPILEEPIRCCTNSSDITSNGDLYYGARLDLILPTKAQEKQRARISVANVDRRIGLAARTMLTPATITFDIIKADDPDTIEIAYPPMLLTDIRGDVSAVTGELREQMNQQDPWPQVRATKSIAPGVYA